MQITQIDIKNFRGIEELSLKLDDLCVLIGENNSGKSTILDAIRLCLTRNLTRRSVFEEYDYHLAGVKSDPANAEPIEIILTFQEISENDWTDDLVSLLSDAIWTDKKNKKSSIRLRVSSSFNMEIVDYQFLDMNNQEMLRARNPRILFNLQRTIPSFYLASLRDAAHEFQARSQFWAPFVKSFELDDEMKSELESALSDLNQKVLDQHKAFESVKDRLKETARLMSLDDTDPVSIEAVPSRVFDILSRTQVNLTSRTGARIPVVRHGSGTQSLAVISLFDAFLQSQLAEGYGEHAEPLLAMEEPEAHLHPSAIKGVGKVLKELSGQKLITTHSGELLADIPLIYVRRLRRIDGKITAYGIDSSLFSADEMNKLNYHVRTLRGSLLFSRCWLLVEGQTEATLMPECARAMGHDLTSEGVSCVEFTGVDITVLIKLADQLGIEWFALADKDDAGDNYIKSAQKHLEDHEFDEHTQQLDHGTMEVFLCMTGFGEIYQNTISDQKASTVKAKEGSLEYWKQVVKSQQNKTKTRNAIVVAERIIDEGIGSVPKLLQSVIERTLKLARG